MYKYIRNDFTLQEYLDDRFIPQLKYDLFGTPICKTVQSSNFSIPYIEIEMKENDEQTLKDNIKKIHAAGSAYGSPDLHSVKGKIINKDIEEKVKIKLRGDEARNFVNGIRYAPIWLSTKKGNEFMGMSKFSLLCPWEEAGTYGYLYYLFFSDQGIISNNLQYVNLKWNGEDRGIYLLQEGFRDHVFLKEGYTDGLILKFENDYRNDDLSYQVRPEIKAYNQKSFSSNPKRKEYWLKTQHKYREFKNGNLPIREFLDTKKYAKFVALSDIFFGHHAMACHNIRMFYNPETELLEPIAWDPRNIDLCSMKEIDIKTHIFGHYIDNNWWAFYGAFAEDTTFLKDYNNALEYYCFSDTIENFFSKHSNQIAEIQKLSKNQTFNGLFRPKAIKNNLSFHKSELRSNKLVELEYHPDIKKLVIYNNNHLPVEITKASTDDNILLENKIFFNQKTLILNNVDSSLVLKAKLIHQDSSFTYTID